jgi:hypothetical protein
MEGPRKKVTAKQEIPPDIHKAFQGATFSDEDVLSLATLLAQGKAIKEASFTKTKHKLYEEGVKAKIEIAAERIKAMYSSKEGVNVNSTLFENPLLKQYVLGKQTSESSASAEGMSGYGIRNKIRKLEDELGSKEIPESDKGRLEEERDALKKQLPNTKKRQEPVGKKETQPDSSVLELTEDQIIPDTRKAETARRPRDYTHEEWAAVLKEPFQDIAGLEHGESGHDNGTVAENRSEFKALRAKVVPLSEKVTTEKDILELTEEYKPQTVEAAPAERAVLTEAEGEYLTAYKEFHKNKKFWNIGEPQDLKALEKTYNEARLEYADALDARLGGRMLEKYTRRNVTLMVTAEDGTLIQNPLLDPDRAEKVRSRYNRLVRFNEVIKPAAEKKLDARTEALSSKEKGIMGKVGEWVQNKDANWQNSLVESLGEQKGKMVHKALRATAMAIALSPVAALGATMFGAGVTTGAVAFAGARVGKSLWGAFAGGAIAVKVGSLFEKTIGRANKESGEYQLKTSGKDGYSLDMERLTAIDKERSKLLVQASDATLQKNKRIVQLLTAYGVGAGTSHILSNWPSLHETVTAATDSGTHPNITDQPVAPKAIVGAGGNQPPAAASNIELTVAKGEGANQLFQDLKAQYAGPERYPANLRDFLNRNPAEMAKHLGFGRENGGVELHYDNLGADKLSIDDHGRLVFYDHVHGDKPTIVVDEKGNISDEWSSRIHNLQRSSGHSVDQHQPKREHIARERVARPHTAGKSFDAQSDQSNVAAANKAELARVQSGDFGVTTTVPEAVPSGPATTEVLPQPVPAPEAASTPSAGAIETAVQPSTSGNVDTQVTPERPTISNAEAIPAPRPTTVPETTSRPTSTESAAPSHPAEAPTQFTTEGYEKMALPYVNANGEVFVYGGPKVSVQQLEIMARSHAQANPGTLVRFTIPRHGFLGIKGPHVEGIIAKEDGTFETIRTLPNGKPFPPIDRTTFVGISRDRQP